jgi:hypothetical protein
VRWIPRIPGLVLQGEWPVSMAPTGVTHERAA